MLSIIIPSRCDEYLQKTIDDLLSKAEGEIEIIVVLDGYWPTTPIKDNPKVRIIHHGTQFDNRGMRASINMGMSLAKGFYVMKVDEHTMMDEGYDIKLAADCKDNWVVIPRRYRLDAEKWEIVRDHRPPVDYNFIAYPYERIGDQTCGLHGSEWRRRDRDSILLDQNLTMQGSCYFTTREWWFKSIGPLDDSHYGSFTMEAQEVSLKSIFSGGEVMVNKKTFHCHMHKGKNGKKYGFSNAQYKKHGEEKEKGRLFAIDYWLNTKDYLPRDWAWLINEKFPGMPGWGINWKEDLVRDAILEKENLTKGKI